MAKLTRIEVLKKARGLIKAGWIQGLFSAESDGKPCFCAVGALREVSEDGGRNYGSLKALDVIAQKSNAACAMSYNDRPSTTQAVEVLKAAREILTDPAKWTKGWFARDASGQRCSDQNSQATCFCSLGAVYRVTGEHPYEGRSEAFSALDEEAAARGGESTASFNDLKSTTHADVLALFDGAIARAEKAGAP